MIIFSEWRNEFILLFYFVKTNVDDFLTDNVSETNVSNIIMLIQQELLLILILNISILDI